MPGDRTTFASLTPAVLPGRPEVALCMRKALPGQKPPTLFTHAARGETLAEALVVALALESVEAPVLDQVTKASRAWTCRDTSRVVDLLDDLSDTLAATVPGGVPRLQRIFRADHFPPGCIADVAEDRFDWPGFVGVLVLVTFALLCGVAIGANPPTALAPAVEVFRGR